MMLHAWNNYKLYAWGKNGLSPISKKPFNDGVFGHFNIGATIIDALDTLYLMNLTREYEEGRNWIATEFSLDDVDAFISVFETNIRFLGGLLSLYALTGDGLFKEKAKYVADKLLPAFKSPTGIPFTRVNFKTGKIEGGSSILSDFGTIFLEFIYLSSITGDSTYKNIVDRIKIFLNTIEKPYSLYPTWLDPINGTWDSTISTMGGLGDSFYEYLLKTWIQSNKTDKMYQQMFNEAMKGVKNFMVKVNPDNFTYLSGVVSIFPDYRMEHLACFAGGMFTLASNTTIDSSSSSQFLKLAEELTNTCHALYQMTNTGLGPEASYLRESIKRGPAKKLQILFDSKYILRPETIESYFYLWRITNNPMYRDWGWEVVNSIEKYCRTPNGYSGVQNVFNDDPVYDDIQQSFFLAETLKYLYLLFSEDNILPLNKWVFNTEAHPLPIMENLLL
uniref:alpha-1,2-Mannosidase n=1 Tax=Culicoides sonorensis TaxID=179676 RepID=A0A336KNG8_CULSO